MYMYRYVCVYIYIYTFTSLSLCIHIYIYIYIYGYNNDTSNVAASESPSVARRTREMRSPPSPPSLSRAPPACGTFSLPVSDPSESRLDARGAVLPPHAAVPLTAVTLGLNMELPVKSQIYRN